MHAERTNRTMLILFALALIAVGAVGALAGFKVFGSATQRGTLLGNRVGAFFGDHGDWLWPVVALGAAIIALLALRWLLALLLSTDRAGDFRLPRNDEAGRTTLAAGALTSAVSEEIATYPGVSSARARLIGDSSAPTLALTATLEASADLSRLRRRIEDGAVAHARQAMSDPKLPVQLDLAVSERVKSHLN
jgi:hypothetical protein